MKCKNCGKELTKHDIKDNKKGYCIICYQDKINAAYEEDSYRDYN